MSYRHSSRRSRRVDDRVIGGIAFAMSRASEPELQAAMTQHLRARNLRGTFRQAADIAIQRNGGLPLAVEFHEDAIQFWPGEANMLPRPQAAVSAALTESLVTVEHLPLTDEV